MNEEGEAEEEEEEEKEEEEKEEEGQRESDQWGVCILSSEKISCLTYHLYHSYLKIWHSQPAYFSVREFSFFTVDLIYRTNASIDLKSSMTSI